MEILNVFLMAFAALVSGFVIGLISALIAERVNGRYSRHVFDTLGVGLAVGASVFALLLLTYATRIEGPVSVTSFIVYALAFTGLYISISNAHNEVGRILSFRQDGWPPTKEEAEEKKSIANLKRLHHMD